MVQRIGMGGAAAVDAARGGRRPEMQEACEDMEALFLKQLLSEMRRAGGAAMRGPGGEMYQELFDQELADHLARSGSLGVARMVREQIERTAAPAPDPRSPAGPGPGEPGEGGA